MSVKEEKCDDRIMRSIYEELTDETKPVEAGDLKKSVAE
jgi:hypothetical protein